MSFSNETKVVGQPCRFCGTPYSEGKNGAYCKPCYVKWKNGQEGQGVNQTPKSYNQAPRPQTTQGGANFAQKQASQEPDWNKISEGKVRHGVSIAFIEAGAGLNGETAKKINAWTRFIMTGHVDPTDIDPSDIF